MSGGYCWITSDAHHKKRDMQMRLLDLVPACREKGKIYGKKEIE
jgi:hypothetical protein